MAGFGGFLIVVLVIDAILGAVASSIWSNKGGSPAAGFAMGFFLGVIGIVIAAVGTPSRSTAGRPMPRTPPMAPPLPVPPTPAPVVTTVPAVADDPSVPRALRECPFCREGMQRNASVCPHCRRESAPWTYRDGRWWTTDAEGRDRWFNDADRTWRMRESG